MTDDLRTRIAKALYGQLFWITTQFEDQPDEVKDPWLFQADIVIRELGRYEYAVATADMTFVYMYADERSELDDFPLHVGEQIVRRYVTEWEST